MTSTAGMRSAPMDGRGPRPEGRVRRANAGVGPVKNARKVHAVSAGAGPGRIAARVRVPRAGVGLVVIVPGARDETVRTVARGCPAVGKRVPRVPPVMIVRRQMIDPSGFGVRREVDGLTVVGAPSVVDPLTVAGDPSVGGAREPAAPSVRAGPVDGWIATRRRTPSVPSVEAGRGSPPAHPGYPIRSSPTT